MLARGGSFQRYFFRNLAISLASGGLDKWQSQHDICSEQLTKYQI
ncbi:hypothetical protein M7I_0632 [Glarea lozoyensis 74030]|uniref:Uncharacterized protein n=1 Tax=Glarea lozoyensis (strain ATCC 74030 / MF5533) TaxID=1104152 RepID=H0EDI3_GLAL7|nr:hypothetical protein M7I_0632 [Glarea lozoyensis 74030]